jgi:hypothetical protein
MKITKLRQFLAAELTFAALLFNSNLIQSVQAEEYRPLNLAREQTSKLPPKPVLIGNAQRFHEELHAPSLIVPSAATNSLIPFGAGSLNTPDTREQEVYGSTLFPASPILITEIHFQPDF